MKDKYTLHELRLLADICEKKRSALLCQVLRKWRTSVSGSWKWEVCSCADLKERLHRSYIPEDRKLYKFMFKASLAEMPLYVNVPDSRAEIAEWRMKLGK